MQAKSVDRVNRMALAVLLLAGLMLATGCHKKNRRDMAQDDQLQLMDQDVETGPQVEFEDPPQSVQAAPEPVPQIVPEAPPPPVDTVYSVRRGDTLWSIAKQHYGDGQRWKEIVKANPGLDPSKLKVGQQIVLP